MKKILSVLAMLLLICSLASAKDKKEDVTPTEASQWHISMMPEPTAQEKEEARWSVILENNVGLYAYDMASLHYAALNEKAVNKNLVNATVKTVFNDKKMLNSLNKKYEDKLKRKETVQYSLMDMQFNLMARAYKMKNMQVFGSKNTLVDTIKHENNTFAPVPAQTFAEAMLEICQTAANEEQGIVTPKAQVNGNAQK